jgi:NADH-quinone oxidoreductase subunit J
MDQAVTMMPTVVFFIIGTIAVASSILVVAMRNPVHSALFLLLTFLCVAVIFILVGAEFVGAVQVLVYAGGIMVLFLFVVMLINVRELPEHSILSPYWKGALGIGLGLFILFASVVRGGAYAVPVSNEKALRSVSTKRTRTVTNPDGSKKQETRTRRREIGNAEAVGMVLYRDYLVPFEVASIFLLVAMVGAIVIGKRELESMDEDIDPSFITKRAADEKVMKKDSDA